MEEIGEQAKQEAKMETTLGKLATIWAEVEFIYEPHKGNCQVSIYFRQFSVKIAILSEQKGFQESLQKKGIPQLQISNYDQAPRLPDSPPRVRGFLNKNQHSDQETTTAAHF